MFLSQRARVLAAKFNDVPAEDVLRFFHPRAYLPVLRKVFAAYSSQAASDGPQFASILRGKSHVPRPIARWAGSI